MRKSCLSNFLPSAMLGSGQDSCRARAATLKFNQPSVFEADNALGEITGLYMQDEEGELTTVDVNAKFINGQPAAIEAKYVMRSTENGLGFAGVCSPQASEALWPSCLLERATRVQ
jgi:photosystem II reaction center protein Psb28